MSKLLPIQALRAFAALAVAALHAQHDAETLASRAGLPFAYSGLFPWPAGVDVFFVISGFIMVYASRGLFARADGARIFLGRRIARIVPLYWGLTSLYLLVELAAPALLNTPYQSSWYILSSYLFIPVARSDGTVQPLYGLGWTLNYEMFFYACFAVAIALPRRRAVPALILAFLALVLAGRLLAPLPTAPAFWSDPIVLEFAFGMGIGLARAEGLMLPLPARMALLAAGLALFHLDLASPEAGAWPRFLAWGVPAALMVAAAGLEGGEREASLITRIGVAIGDASYALYLIHPFVIRLLREAVWRLDLFPILGRWGFVVFCLTGAVGASVLVYALLERPLVERARRLLRA